MQGNNSLEKTTRDLVANEFQIRKEKIKTYLSNDEADEDFLSAKEKEYLQRWTYADELIRAGIGKKNRGDIALHLMERFRISRGTAYQDIVNAEEVFSSTCPFNKHYRIPIRIELMEKIIREASIAKDYKSVAALEKVLATYIDMLPNDPSKKDAPSQITYHINGEKIVNQLIVASIDEAKSIIANYQPNSTDGEES